MAFHCPECHEAQVAYLGGTDDAKSHLRCKLCDHEWLHGGERAPAASRSLTFEEARTAFVTGSSIDEPLERRVATLKTRFLQRHPEPDPAVAPFWAKYRAIFSAQRLPHVDPADLKYFANTGTGAGVGNMSVFNRSWNELGDEAAAVRLRSVVDYLLRGPADVPIEDRLTRLVDPEDTLGMTGFRESLLTKVLCIMDPDRFLPILIYTSPAGGKREIAQAVFGLRLPAPERTAMTRGRLAVWSNDLLVEAVGAGFVDLQHASSFLWWAKDQEVDDDN